MGGEKRKDRMREERRAREKSRSKVNIEERERENGRKLEGRMKERDEEIER